ncbi:MAG: nucleoside-diphosphate sugar epimerase [Candidatus Aenigmatarchaeota archaeon]|nr:MAG: nucleoside-diphosphate sugar epimerase [Candidatus Aenigmarchaeota archaeon]
MEVLVTGGAGFIGSNLVEKLAKRHEVAVFDTFHTGKKENLRGIKCRILKRPEAVRPKIIFHLGMPSSSPMYRENRYKLLECLEVSIRVFELARKTDSKIVYASTSSLYNGNKPPFKEDMPVIPTDFYTEGRYWVERLAKVYDSLYGLRSVGLRLFSVYGPRDARKGRYANIITQFALEIMRGRRPVIYGNGRQTRDFIHVEDVVRAFILASKYPKTDIFNVGTGEEHSFNDVVRLLNRLLGKNIKPVYKPNPIRNYVKRTLADMRKARRLLGFKARYGFEDGIKRYLEWLKKNLNT